MTDKALVATWEGVFEASSVEVLTDVAEVTDRLRRGAEDLQMGLTAKKKPRFSPSGEGILESELVRLPISLIGSSEEAIVRLQECWEDLIGNQSAAVNMSVAAGNVADRLLKTIEIELDQVDVKFAQLKRGIGNRPSSLGTTTVYDTVTALNAETKELKQAVDNLTACRQEEVKSAVDEAMTFWQAEMASNLEATMEPMRGLFFALSTDKDKAGDVVLQEVMQLKEGLLELRQRTSGVFDLGSGALDKMDLGEKEGLGVDLSQRVKSLEDEIVELKEQLASARVVVGGVSFNSKPQAQAWLNQTGGLASILFFWRWIRAVFWRGRM